MDHPTISDYPKILSKSGSLYGGILFDIITLVTHSTPFIAMLSLHLYNKNWTKTHCHIHIHTFIHTHTYTYVCECLCIFMTLNEYTSSGKCKSKVLCLIFSNWKSFARTCIQQAMLAANCPLPPFTAARYPIGSRTIRISVYLNIFRRVVRIVRFKCNASVYCRNMSRILT